MSDRVIRIDAPTVAAVIDDLRFAVNYHATYGNSRIANAARAAIEALETKERVNDAPPRGWLTEEERSLVESLRATFQQNADSLRSAGLVGHVENWDRKVRLFDALLASSSPPKVKMPPASRGETPLVRDLMWGQAIREAGGEVE